MSFALKSIELNNIRAHEYFLFEPAVEGITAISGDNGAGKSSIVDAFAWGMYGTRPTGVKNKDLIKDGVDPKTKPISVRSIIISGGVEYAIERKIINKQGTTECNVWGKKPGGTELKHIAGPGVSHVEKFIRGELGMNEKGFLTSVLIQQKQVDQIVSASPRERGAVIEELTGIASITQAITRTNENTRALEKASASFKVEDVGEATEKVDKQKDVCDNIEEQERLAIMNFNGMKESHSSLKLRYASEYDKVEKRRTLERQIDVVDKQIEFLEKQSKEDTDYISSFKNISDETSSDIEDKRKAVVDKRAEAYELKSRLSSLKSEIKSAELSVDKYSILKGGYSSQLEAANKASIIEDELSKTNVDLSESKSLEIMLASEIKHSKESHNHLSDENTSCPICKSTIEDPKKLLEEIEAEIAQFKDNLRLAKNKTKELERLKGDLSEELKAAHVSIDAIDNESQLLVTLNELGSQVESLVDEDISMSRVLKRLEDDYDNALRIEADRKALLAAKERLMTVHTTINENRRQIDMAEIAIKELNSMTDSNLDILLDEMNKSQEDLTALSISGREIRGRKSLELERLGDYEDNLKKVKDSVEQYENIAEQIEISAAASAVLTAFKSDRIENSIPTLEFFASDFLSKFTGGMFTKLTIDEKFNTFVTTSSDVMRPVAQLSGGELSSAAIALRLGIAMLLSSSEKNVLILDEVLVSMDEDRSRQIMETIGSMSNSQVIFIAHNNDINSVADKTVMVSK